MNINPLESIAELVQPSCHYFQIKTDLEPKNNQEFICSFYDSVQVSIFVVDVLAEQDFRYLGLNSTYEQWRGIRCEDVKGKTPEQAFSPVDAAKARQHYNECIHFGTSISYEECWQSQEILTWWSTILTPVRDCQGRIYRLIGTSTNITERKQAEEALRRQTEREELLKRVTQRICPNLDLNEFSDDIVTELRRYLSSDRILIYRFQSDGSGVIVAESNVATASPLLGKTITDHCFIEKHRERYKRGCIQNVEDIYAAGLDPCQINFLARLQVRANLVVPIVCQQDLWGLLIAQHCYQPRQWQQTDIDLLEQLATQIGIAIHQTNLHQQVQRLQTQLKLEAVVERITKEIRDNLDIDKVWTIVAFELAEVLQAQRCQIELYNSSYSMTTIAYEYTTALPWCQGMTRMIADFPELYKQLLEKQSLQFGEIMRDWSPNLVVVTQLACPIFDAQELMGNIWLTKTTDKAFEEWEINLVQQVANQCAIALSRAKLYQLAQTRVKELEKLDKLKYELLRTLSHELQTPITSINLAVQTLETVIKQEKVLDPDLISQLLQILHNECGRESKLINDLLTLTSLEADIEPLTLITIDFQTWLTPIVESFRELANCQQQKLILNLAEGLPQIETDITDLQRIITELISNACKYTPVGGTITITASATTQTVEISVSNSGIGIPTNHLSRIFDPFYRIPHNDPWKYTGTGMGLALVKKLVKHLKASIRVESAEEFTKFTLVLPLIGK